MAKGGEGIFSTYQYLPRVDVIERNSKFYILPDQAVTTLGAGSTEASLSIQDLGYDGPLGEFVPVPGGNDEGPYLAFIPAQYELVRDPYKEYLPQILIDGQVVAGVGACKEVESYMLRNPQSLPIFRLEDGDLLEVRFGNRSWSVVVNSPVSGLNLGFSFMESSIPKNDSCNRNLSFFYGDDYRKVFSLCYSLPRVARTVSDSLCIRREAIKGLGSGFNIVDPRRFWSIVNVRSAGERSRSNMLDQVLKKLYSGWNDLIQRNASHRDIILYLLRWGIVVKDVTLNELRSPNISFNQWRAQLLFQYVLGSQERIN